jgi:hypothetical protein
MARREIGSTDPSAEGVADTVVTRTGTDPGYHPENLAAYLGRGDRHVEDVDEPVGAGP